MKWEKPTGPTQHSSDGNYCVVQANSQDWIAYRMHSTTATDLGVRKSDEAARQCCEDHARVPT